MFEDALTELAVERREVLAGETAGFTSPVALTVMGEGSDHCAADAGEDRPVVTGRSECVLSYDLDAPRALVREFYGAAAESPDEDLCCPVRPDPEDLEHIPPEHREDVLTALGVLVKAVDGLQGSDDPTEETR